MPILSGKRQGPYEILSSVGAGGMGEVYRARDTRLERIVAINIKVLPTHLAGWSELGDRFERETRTTASLNHPHICILFDIDQQDGASVAIRHRDCRHGQPENESELIRPEDNSLVCAWVTRQQID